MTTMKRRTFLKGALASGVVVTAAGAGLLQPTEVLAAGWKGKAIREHDMNKALKLMFGTSKASKSSNIKIEAPIQAENGAVVRVSGETGMKATQMAIVIEKNPAPIAAAVDLQGNAGGYFRTHVKMGKTSDVHVYVKAGGKLYMATQKIKVTVGGCGG